MPVLATIQLTVNESSRRHYRIRSPIRFPPAWNHRRPGQRAVGSPGPSRSTQLTARFQMQCRSAHMSFKSTTGFLRRVAISNRPISGAWDTSRFPDVCLRRGHGPGAVGKGPGSHHRQEDLNWNNRVSTSTAKSIFHVCCRQSEMPRSPVDIRTYIFDNDDYRGSRGRRVERPSLTTVDVRVMFDGIGNLAALRAHNPDSMPTDFKTPISMETLPGDEIQTFKDTYAFQSLADRRPHQDNNY